MAIQGAPAGSALGTGPGHFGPRRKWVKVLVAASVGLVVVAAVAVGVIVSRSPAGHAPAASAASTTDAGSGPGGSATTAGPTPAQRLAAQLAAALVVAPEAGATTVALDAPVEVMTPTGQLTAVNVTPVAPAGGAGAGALPGTFDVTNRTWTASAAALAPSTTYRISTTLTGPTGVAASSTAEFTTLTPTATVRASLWPDSGLSVGIGQPVTVTFNHAVTSATAQQALVSHLRLTLSVPVPVGWYWFSPTELHLRPETYWPTSEKVTFSDNLAGWDVGGGMWGGGSGSITFSIGDARVSTANLATDQMTVTDNGAVVATYPISAGRTQYPTMNGTHIVMDRTSVLRMNSATVGIPVNSPNGYDETVLWDVHISDSGEYVHAAPWSVSDQGHINVSHGCVNLSTANAQSFFNFSRVGDIVNVVGGPRAPVAGDHGVMDWTTPWSSFTPLTTS